MDAGNQRPGRERRPVEGNVASLAVATLVWIEILRIEVIALAETDHVSVGIHLPYIHVSATSCYLAYHVSKIVVDGVCRIVIGMVIVFRAISVVSRRCRGHWRLVVEMPAVSGSEALSFIVMALVVAFVFVAVFIFVAVGTLFVEFLLLASIVVVAAAVVVGKCHSGSGDEKEGEERGNYQTSHGSDFFVQSLKIAGFILHL